MNGLSVTIKGHLAAQIAKKGDIDVKTAEYRAKQKKTTGTVIRIEKDYRLYPPQLKL